PAHRPRCPPRLQRWLSTWLRLCPGYIGEYYQHSAIHLQCCAPAERRNFGRRGKAQQRKFAERPFDVRHIVICDTVEALSATRAVDIDPKAGTGTHQLLVDLAEHRFQVA